MNERKKNILPGVLIVGIILMTVVFVLLSQTLNINGSAKVKNLDSSWNIHFAHISNTANEVHTSGHATTSSQSITLDDTTVTVPGVTLKAPGDKVEYIFKVVNEGEITGYINVINNIGIGTITYAQGETLTAEQKTTLQNDIQVTLTYNDQSKTRLAYNDSLAKNQEKELILTIQYVNRETTQVLPSSDVTFTNITASITYGQDQTSNSGNGTNPGSPEVIEPSGQFTMSAMCPGCVFAKTTSAQWIGEALAVETTNSYSSYSDGESFLGYIVEGNIIKRAFACGIEKGQPFCLEGYDASKQANNIDILNHFFPSCKASSSSSYAWCNGSSVSDATANEDGSVSVTDSSHICGVNGYNGSAYC